MKGIVVLFSIFLSSLIFGGPSQSIITLEQRSEAFILKTTSKQALIFLLNGELKGQKVWVSKDVDPLSFKIYTKDSIDSLLKPTDDWKKAFYMTFSFSAKGKRQGDKLSPIERAYMEEHLFSRLENYVPISNAGVPELADDLNLACPKVPRKKNGESCPVGLAYKLPAFLIEEIRALAIKHNEDPILVASIIHQESQYDLFIDNDHERKKCLKLGRKCSPYRWGYGLAQLGRSDAALYGLNWDLKLKRDRKCKKKANLMNEKCFMRMEEKCRKYKNSALKPINCPRAAIEAVVRKVKAMVPSKTTVWLEESNQVVYHNLSEEFTSDPIEEARVKVGLYNRAIKVVNSYVEYFDQHGRFPRFYGEAWAMPRTADSPSLSLGYQMLTKEYINRCYVWKVAGLCGEMPNSSLYKQYEGQF